MTSLPNAFQWLNAEPGPQMVLEAIKLYGTAEGVGSRDNSDILAWAKALHLADYDHDAIPWCGLFMATIAVRANKTPPAAPLWALNWKKFGVSASRPMLGDVLVKSRLGGGHVTMYVGEDDEHYYCFGGNQGDAVSIAKFSKNLDWTFRRPAYNIQPANVRVIRLSDTGMLLNTKES